MGRSRLEIPKQRLAEFCRRHHIQKLALFGSVLREDFRSDSDIDVLVEFEPDHVPGLRFIDLQDELSAIFGGREIDLVTQKFLNRRIRDIVLEDAEVQYARA